MLDLESFSEKLRQSLEGYLDQPRVRAIPGDFHKVLGITVSPTFEGLEKAERPEIVWDRVLKTFPSSEHTRIEFLFTDAPSEDRRDVPAQGWTLGLSERLTGILTWPKTIRPSAT